MKTTIILISILLINTSAILFYRIGYNAGLEKRNDRIDTELKMMHSKALQTGVNETLRCVFEHAYYTSQDSIDLVKNVNKSISYIVVDSVTKNNIWGKLND